MIVLLYIERKQKIENLDVILRLHRRQATQSARTWYDYS